MMISAATSQRRPSASQILRQFTARPTHARQLLHRPHQLLERPATSFTNQNPNLLQISEARQVGPFPPKPRYGGIQYKIGKRPKPKTTSRKPTKPAKPADLNGQEKPAKHRLVHRPAPQLGLDSGHPAWRLSNSREKPKQIRLRYFACTRQ